MLATVSECYEWELTFWRPEASAVPCQRPQFLAHGSYSVTTDVAVSTTTAMPYNILDGEYQESDHKCVRVLPIHEAFRSVTSTKLDYLSGGRFIETFQDFLSHATLCKRQSNRSAAKTFTIVYKAAPNHDLTAVSRLLSMESIVLPQQNCFTCDRLCPDALLEATEHECKL